MGIHDNEAIFLTQEEQELFLLNQTKVSGETEGAGQPTWEDDILEVNRQYNLRSKKTEGNSPRKATEMQKVVETEKAPQKTIAGNPHRALPEDDFPAKSSDFRAIFSPFLSNPDHQSPVSFFHIFHQRESDYFGCVCSTCILF
jgi:hypothetical protein